jgi:hypothetical protein
MPIGITPPAGGPSVQGTLQLMDERRPTARYALRAVWCCAVLTMGLLTVPAARSEEYRDPCDTSKTSWDLAYDRTRVRSTRHERDGYEYHSGTAAEAVRFTARESGSGSFVRLSHRAPRSQIYDELKATLWVRSNRTGATLAVRIVLPHEQDPGTNEPVAFDLHGEAYTDLQRWQQLTCQLRSEAIEQQLKLLRSRLTRFSDGRTLNTSQMYVSQVVLKVPAEQGTTDLLLDDLRFGPIVRSASPQAGGEIIRVEGTSGGDRPECPIRIETNRLLVNGRPFFPRIIPYHGEPLGSLAEAGVNVAWIEQYDDQILMNALAERGIWSMATPPRATGGDGGVLQSAGLMPIPATTGSVLLWSMGTRVPPQDLRQVEAWIDQLRDADRAFSSPRPVLADVIGDERRFSRYVSLLGTSRHTLHTTITPLQYHGYLDHRQKLALPDRFKWTWIQTEPADGNVVTRSESRDRPVLVEAEQIWLQAWTAICVGHKALGYWSATALDESSPAAQERRLALALLNAQIDLLEPWLATGKVVDENVPVAVRLKQSPDLGRRGYSFRGNATSRNERDALLVERERERTQAARVSAEVKAAVIESSFGRLVIPVWYDHNAQFQPGQMAAQDVSVLVRGLVDARAWQVTTTAVKPLDMSRVAGGMQVDLPMMDQHAFVVITADSGLEDKLMQRMREMRRRCGHLWVELAASKLERVRQTHAEIDATAAPKIPDAAFLLSSASSMLDQAREQLQKEQYSEAERLSRYVMQLLRQLQRTHWENAVAGLIAPTSSPHAVCFNTLPDHWRLMSGIGRSTQGVEENLLRSGNFEDLNTMRVDGWEQKRTAVADPQRKIAELDEDAASGRLCLRVRSSSARGAPPAQHIGPDVLVTSPRLPVRGGQIVFISGRVRVDQIEPGDIDGLMIYDNIKGTVGALRWQRVSAGGRWEDFQIIREVLATTDVQLTIELHGEGDVRLDDLNVMALGTTLAVDGTQPRDGAGTRRSLLDFAPSLPKVSLWPGRKSDETPPGADPPTPE